MFQFLINFLPFAWGSSYIYTCIDCSSEPVKFNAKQSVDYLNGSNIAATKVELSINDESFPTVIGQLNVRNSFGEITTVNISSETDCVFMIQSLKSLLPASTKYQITSIKFSAPEEVSKAASKIEAVNVDFTAPYTEQPAFFSYFNIIDEIVISGSTDYSFLEGLKVHKKLFFKKSSWGKKLPFPKVSCGYRVSSDADMERTFGLFNEVCDSISKVIVKAEKVNREIGRTAVKISETFSELIRKGKDIEVHNGLKYHEKFVSEANPKKLSLHYPDGAFY
jgi:hypothetical protein